ncbi:MAG: hypothetical protein AAGF58_09955 [Pseudomonadota bacterium]
MRVLITAFLAVFLCLALPGRLAAAAACAGTEELVSRLVSQYGERPAAEMVDHRGALIRLLVNPQSGTWTMLATAPVSTRVSCVIGAGEGFVAASQVTAPSPQS